MSLFGDIGRGALGFSTGGLSEVGRYLANSGGGNPTVPYKSQKPTMASDIQIDPNLMAVLGEQGKGPQNSLNAVYDRIRSQFGQDQAARGVRGGSPYATETIGSAQDASNAGLRGSLESVLGNTAYKDFGQARDFSQNQDLAQYIGELNRPSQLEEILGALGGVGGAAGNIYGALGSKKKANPLMNEPNPSYYSSGGTGLNLYGY